MSGRVFLVWNLNLEHSFPCESHQRVVGSVAIMQQNPYCFMWMGTTHEVGA